MFHVWSDQIVGFSFFSPSCTSDTNFVRIFSEFYKSENYFTLFHREIFWTIVKSSRNWKCFGNNRDQRWCWKFTTVEKNDLYNSIILNIRHFEFLHIFLRKNLNLIFFWTGATGARFQCPGIRADFSVKYNYDSINFCEISMQNLKNKSEHLSCQWV